MIDVKQFRDVSRSADSALRTFLQFGSFSNEVPQIRTVSYASPLISMNRNISRGEFPCTDPHLYDRFVKFRMASGRWDGDVRSLDSLGDATLDFSGFKSYASIIDLGMLLAVHHSKPNPGFLLAYSRRMPERSKLRFFEPKTLNEVLFQLTILRRLESILSRQGRSKDAAWVQNFAKPLLASENRMRTPKRRHIPTEAASDDLPAC